MPLNEEFNMCMHEEFLVQVRTGTSKSTRGHRDPALTWEVPAPLHEASSGPAQKVTCLTLLAVQTWLNISCDIASYSHPQGASVLLTVPWGNAPKRAWEQHIHFVLGTGHTQRMLLCTPEMFEPVAFLPYACRCRIMSTGGPRSIRVLLHPAQDSHPPDQSHHHSKALQM